MSQMDMLDVIEVAKHFSDVAGWGFFKLVTVDFNNINEWKLVAVLGGFDEFGIEFIINDNTRKVVSYGKFNPDKTNN